MNSETSVDIRNCFLEGVDYIKRVQSLRNFFINSNKIQDSKIKILNNISFSCRSGDKLALIGGNGSGKSSILKMIGGIYPQKSGEKKIVGNVTSIIEMGLGMEPEFSGRDNIKILMLYNNLIAEYNEDLQQKVIEFSELGDKIDQQVKTYSSGMLARLAFSASIFHNPDILLLDEVFATGDQHFVAKSLAFMKNKINTVPIVIMVSHQEDIIREHCNRCILLDKGSIKMEGTPEKILPIYKTGDY
jgi:lipopolysaccharide transport system ATP-binding protein